MCCSGTTKFIYAIIPNENAQWEKIDSPGTTKYFYAYDASKEVLTISY